MISTIISIFIAFNLVLAESLILFGWSKKRKLKTLQNLNSK